MSGHVETARLPFRPAASGGVTWLIVRREISEHVRSVRFIALFVLVVSMMPLGAFINARDLEVRRAQYEALVDDAQRRVAEEDRPSWAFDSYRPDPALRALRAPQPLSFLAMGLDALLPTYWQFDSQGTVNGPPVKPETSRSGLVGEIDLLFVIQVILGLLALLLAFDAISGEKENGTLRAVLANPLPRSRLLLGKYLALVFALLAPLVLGTLAALLVVQLMGVAVVNAAALARVGVFLLAAVAYLVALAGIGLLVSAASHRQRTALVMLLVLWVGVILVLPRFSTVLAEAVHAVPPLQLSDRQQDVSIKDLARERHAALAEIWKRVSGRDDLPQAPEFRELQAGRNPELHDLLAAYLEDKKTLDRGFYDRKRQVIRDVDSVREAALGLQRRLASAVSRISPAAVFGFVATDAAGTGELARRRWETQAAAHQRLLEEVYWDTSPGFVVVACGGECEYSDHEFNGLVDVAPAKYEDLPAFEYQEAGLGEIVRTTLPDLGLLLFYGIASIGGAMVLFSRYDVR